jgi:hypothetical protein
VELDGRQVRRVVVTLLMGAGSPMTVADLVERLAEARLTTLGRPGKVVSDSLRWEVGRGRVVRVARGTYVLGRMPRSTAFRIRRQGLALIRGNATCSGEVDELTATANAGLAELLRRRSA